MCGSAFFAESERSDTNDLLYDLRGIDMKTFDEWWEEVEIFAGEGSMDAAEQAWDAAQELTAKRCKEIAQQRYLADSQAVSIDERISKEFCV